MTDSLKLDISKQLSISELTHKQHTVSTSGLDTRLMDLKTRFGNLLQWGEQFAIVTPNDSVLQLAWKDAQTVLFMSIISTPSDTIVRPRKRP
jgi:hypothetical protein